jgi:hypothetical protein
MMTGAMTLTVSEFIRQLGDVELTYIEDLVTKEYRRRAENMVNGVGEAVRGPIRLADAAVIHR